MKVQNELSNSSNAMQQLAEQLSETAYVYRRLVEGVTTMMQAVEGISAFHAAILEYSSANIVSSILESSEHILSALDSDIRSQFEKISIIIRQSFDWGIFDQLRKAAQVKENAVDAFNAAGWPIVPSMSLQLIVRVVGLYREKKVRYASRVIISFYHRRNFEHLNRMVEDWAIHPLFAPRMHILRDALEAHRQGKYTLSVPALLPQIEGILSDYVVANDIPAKLGKIYKVYNAALGDPNSHNLARWTVATLLYQLKNNVYDRTDFDKEIEKPINRRRITRHTILHGIALKYDKPIHSLKTFVLLDALSALQPPR